MGYIKQTKKDKAKYDKLRYQKLRENQIVALGSKCFKCGRVFTIETYDLLEIHHVKPVLKRSRTRAKAYFSTNREEVNILCRYTCHADTPSYRRRKNK